MRRVVVKGNEHLGANPGGKLRSLTVCAVPPPDTLAIFVIGILLSRPPPLQLEMLAVRDPLDLASR